MAEETADIFIQAMEDPSRLKKCYERILRLTDLTIEVNHRHALRREPLRWRDVIAELYIAKSATAHEHDLAFRCLLRFTPAASRQIPYLLPPRSP